MQIYHILVVFSLVAGGSTAEHLRGVPDVGAHPEHRRLMDVVKPSAYSATLKIGESKTVTKTVTISALSSFTTNANINPNVDDSSISVSKAAPPPMMLTPKLDVVFLMDSTGSMRCPIQRVKSTARSILDATGIWGDVAYGVAEYRDTTNPFITHINANLTTDTTTVLNGIRMWNAGVGADEPEAGLFALHKVATRMRWRPNSARMIVWMGDQPSHENLEWVDLDQVINTMKSKNIVVQALNLGNLDELGQATAITAATGGTYYGEALVCDEMDTAIVQAVRNVINTYSVVELRPPTYTRFVNVDISAPRKGRFTRDADRNFVFQATYKCQYIGTHAFPIHVFVDGALVASEMDEIECVSAGRGTLPVAVCQDVSVSTQGAYCDAEASIDGGSDGRGSELTVAQTPPGPYAVGKTDVTMTVTSAAGETDSCSATVTVLDRTGPTAICTEESVKVRLNGDGQAEISAAALDNGSYDNCGELTLYADPPFVDCSNFGYNTVTLVARDKAGRKGSCQAKITVSDPYRKCS